MSLVPGLTDLFRLHDYVRASIRADKGPFTRSAPELPKLQLTPSGLLAALLSITYERDRIRLLLWQRPRIGSFSAPKAHFAPSPPCYPHQLDGASTCQHCV